MCLWAFEGGGAGARGGAGGRVWDRGRRSLWGIVGLHGGKRARPRADELISAGGVNGGDLEVFNCGSWRRQGKKWTPTNCGSKRVDCGNKVNMCASPLYAQPAL